jgi:hypothetical protein
MADPRHVRNLVEQAAQTSALFGVDFVPVYRKRTCAEAEAAGIEVDIGRKGIFGNPFRPAAGEERQGKTLVPYREYLFAAIKGDMWARAQYKEATGIELPLDFAKQVQEIIDLPYWCPGCKDMTEKDGVCHGSILRKAAIWLNESEEGPKLCR